jgi:hypothetical protein
MPQREAERERGFSQRAQYGEQGPRERPEVMERDEEGEGGFGERPDVPQRQAEREAGFSQRAQYGAESLTDRADVTHREEDVGAEIVE